MNLRSCNNCGVVMDLDYTTSPNICDDEGCIIDENAYWDGENYVEVVYCPVCKEKLPRRSND